MFWFRKATVVTHHDRKAQCRKSHLMAAAEQPDDGQPVRVPVMGCLTSWLKT